MAPGRGFEPPTWGLTVPRSTAELPRIINYETTLRGFSSRLPAGRLAGQKMSFLLGLLFPISLPGITDWIIDDGSLARQTLTLCLQSVKLGSQAEQ